MTEKPGIYRIQIRKEALKFAAAHMTVFGPTHKENLHGHNYRTQVQMEFERFSIQEMIPFEAIKNEMKKICQDWDEKVLIPSQCPYLKPLESSPEQFDFELCGKTYSLPRDEVVLLPTDNVTTESLSRIFCERLFASIPTELLRKAGVRSIETQIEEMTGQGAAYVLSV